MKKAQIILLAIVIFTAVGGGLAFRARQYNRIPAFTCNNFVLSLGTCMQFNYLSISSVPLPDYVMMTAITTDPASSGKVCNDAYHPCTSTLYVITTTDAE